MNWVLLIFFMTPSGTASEQVPMWDEKTCLEARALFNPIESEEEAYERIIPIAAICLNQGGD